MKWFFLILVILLPHVTLCQSKTGYYMNWNRDHTGRTIKPMIPLSKEEAKIVNCYWVEFDADDRFIRVKHYNSGQPSERSNFGAHELIRNYYPDRIEESFRDQSGTSINNSSGTNKYVYTLDSDGYWIEINNYDEKGKLTEEYGVASIKVNRDYQNRIATEIHLNLNQDTIPDPNDFKVVHFTYDKNSYMTSRQNRDPSGKLFNGKDGYATVIFQFDHNGMFYGEEFLTAEGDLVVHPNLGYAKIDFREFNKYGKSMRQYYSDENGYPSSGKAMALIKYNSNMSRHKMVFYDRIGDLVEDFQGRASISYSYNNKGEFLKRNYYNLDNELVE